MISNRFHIENLKKGLRNPDMAKKELKRIISNPMEIPNNMYFQLRYDTGIDIIDQDWDNLIILDGCRYDYFKQQNDLNGQLQPVISKSSTSSKFASCPLWLKRPVADT